MAANNPHSPRQKMINLMYLVFIAMMALNIPAEVLDGLEMVEESIGNSIINVTNRNNLILSDFENAYNQNKTKVGPWYEKALAFRKKSDSIFQKIQEMKVLIVKEADGEKGDLHNINQKDDLNAPGTVMLSPLTKRGRKLKEAIDIYRKTAVALLNDPAKQKIVEQNLATVAQGSARKEGKNWEQSLFDQMPVVASITLLTKLQNDIRQTEGDVLTSLLANVDVGDFRVNQINAYVVSKSNVIMQGGTYEANIILSAEDSTKRPRLFVNGRYMDSGLRGMYKIGTKAVGTFPVKGFIELTRGDGSVLKREFSSEYTVIEPMATVAPVLMNLLYAGIQNELSISVPGVPGSNINATMVNGSLTRSGNKWFARPSKVGQDVTIVVTAKMADRTQEVARKQFRVRALPDPAPYIEYTDASGNPKKFKGGRISKAVLVNADRLKAAIDDGFLDISFSVLSFNTIFIDGMGNAIPEISSGPNFSDRQKEQIRRLSRGKYFFISGVKAKGPDGIERDISPMEVRVN